MRRPFVMGLLAVAGLLLGACVPLFDLNPRPDVAESTTFGISVVAPTVSRTVPQGTRIDVTWTAGNVTEKDAIASVIARNNNDLSETIIEGGIRVAPSGVQQTTIWDTTTYPSAQYALRVRIESGDKSGEATAVGRITVDEAPVLTFTEPFEDATLNVSDSNSPGSNIVIRWSASDNKTGATAEIALDTDDDPNSGNELKLTSATIPVGTGLDSFTFSGKDANNADVPKGTYSYFARIDDKVNPKRIVPGLAKIIVPEKPATIQLAITDPNADKQFLTGDSPLKIAYTIDEPNDVLIDLRVDRDDVRTSGNEITILSQRLVAKATKSDSFDWNGNDSAGAAVPDGIYRIFIAVFRGGGAPTTADASGLIFRRSAENVPLISLLDPSTNQNVNVGAFVTMRWRDNDPNGTSVIRLLIQRSGDPEIEILNGRAASGTGVQDTFAYQIPATLAPGTYSVRAEIGRDPNAPNENSSTAAGKIIIKDPNAAP